MTGLFLLGLLALLGLHLRTDAGDDQQADAMGDFSGTDTGTGANVTYAATTVTDTGKAWTVNAWAGSIVVSGAVYGVVLSNTATVLTVDKWYAPATPGGAAGTTPAANATYIILPGNAPAGWMALTESATAPAVTDTTLATELTGLGFQRALATYAHTAAAASFTWTKAFTSADSTTRTIAKAAMFVAQNGGRMPFETLVSPTAVMANTDQTTFTWTVTT